MSFYARLARAARDDDVDVISTLLSRESLDVNQVIGEWSKTPLQIAAEAGRCGAVVALLSNGAHVNAVDSVGCSALWVAAKAGHEQVVAALIDAGANVNLRETVNEQRCALTCAVQNGHDAVVRTLLERGKATVSADVLCVAIRSELDDATVCDLIAVCNRIGHAHQRNNMPLIAAAAAGRVAVLRKLLEQKSLRVDARDRDGASALWHAAAYGRFDCVKVLVDAGADVDVEAKLRETPLMVAARHNHEHVVCFLARFSHKLDATDAYGFSALTHCVACETIAGATELLKRGATPDGALQRICSRSWSCSGKIFALLLAAGCDVDATITDESGDPVSLVGACATRCGTMAEFLIAAGAKWDPVQPDHSAAAAKSALRKKKIHLAGETNANSLLHHLTRVSSLFRISSNSIACL
jgi:ankyrin repeat protein